MKNIYGIEETMKTVIALIYTKFFFKGARLIRRPVYIRGKKFMTYGNGLTTGYSCRFEMFNLNFTNTPKLIIGKNCKIGDYVHIAAGQKIIIGDNCLLASKIYISDISHGNYSNLDISSNPKTPPDQRKLHTNPVEIGDNVWIGENVCVLPGVKIGSGSIIGANSVVNRDIPDNTIGVGVPAKVVKIFNFKKEVWEQFID